ncbi:MAG: diaminopimelate epimerase [Candidatus Bathyarchaeia archaeon]
MVKISFWKMHGLGNDFILIDGRNGKLSDDHMGRLARELCERRFSVGADGLIIVFNSTFADIRMRIFNPDGSEAEMCGNGIRCLAKYCYEKGIVRKKEMKVETLAGVKEVELTVERETVEKVKVNMGKPVWERSGVPMLGEGTFIDRDLELGTTRFRATCLSLGNPHCIIFVDDVKNFPIETTGPEVENHPLFPNRVNVEFAQILNRHELNVRVWERGCGETFACGTGACAAVAAAKVLGKIDGKAIVHLLGGDLEVEYTTLGIYMKGPATKVFEGRMF